jgi:FtsZ-interacting cell division protein ZipA
MGIGRFVSRLLAICAVVVLTLLLVPGRASADVSHKHKSAKHSKVHKKSKSKKKSKKASKKSKAKKKKKNNTQAARKKHPKRKVASIASRKPKKQRKLASSAPPSYEPTPTSMRDGDALFPTNPAPGSASAYEPEVLPGLNDGETAVQ